jgi:L-asparaginase
MLGKDRLDLAFYFDSKDHLSEAQIQERIPELASLARLRVDRVELSGPAMGASDFLSLHAHATAAFREPGVSGVVLTRGTNTLEEIAYFLTLTVRDTRPVVVTAAMRPASAISPDGDLNLLSAVRVAAHPGSRGKGTLVVMNGSIFAARDVTKAVTNRVEAFQARDLGPLGFADPDGEVVFFHETARVHTTASEFDVTGLRSLPRVDIALSYIEADGVAIDAFVAAGAKGIVAAGKGSGQMSRAEDEALTRAREAGIVVVQASRVGAGRVMRGPQLRARHTVAAGNLQPWKAKILLALALTVTTDVERIQEMFDRY